MLDQLVLWSFNTIGLPQADVAIVIEGGRTEDLDSATEVFLTGASPLTIHAKGSAWVVTFFRWDNKRNVAKNWTVMLLKTFLLLEVIPIAVRRPYRLSRLQTCNHITVIDRQRHLFIAKHTWKNVNGHTFGSGPLHQHTQRVWPLHLSYYYAFIYSARNELQPLSKLLARTPSFKCFPTAYCRFTHTRYLPICQ